MIGLFSTVLSLAMTVAVGSGLPGNCTGCDFSNRDLRGADLANVTYVGVDFSGADLRNVNFSNARLTGVDFDHAKLHGARFTGASLVGVDLRGAVTGLNDEDLRGLFHNCVGCDAKDAQLAGRDL